MLSSAGAVLVHVCKRQLTPNGQRGAQKNHLSGLKRRLLKLSFWNEQQLAEVKRDCFPLVRRNRCALDVSRVIEGFQGTPTAPQNVCLLAAPRCTDDIAFASKLLSQPLCHRLVRCPGV